MQKNKITAVLGPTNTGKTFQAIEIMLGFESGMIGFPLRLLAREVYDKVVKKVDPKKVALITGEEKIIPSNAKYFLCTVESMPIDKNLEFVGIDEIQMCSDNERGHVFTDRLIELKADVSKLNVNGGAMALGHPLGATGAKLMTTLLHELERTNGKYGLQAICEGGGTANATIIERI